MILEEKSSTLRILYFCRLCSVVLVVCFKLLFFCLPSLTLFLSSMSISLYYFSFFKVTLRQIFNWVQPMFVTNPHKKQVWREKRERERTADVTHTHLILTRTHTTKQLLKVEKLQWLTGELYTKYKYIHTYIHTYIHIYIHTYILFCILIYIHTDPISYRCCFCSCSQIHPQQTSIF